MARIGGASVAKPVAKPAATKRTTPRKTQGEKKPEQSHVMGMTSAGHALLAAALDEQGGPERSGGSGGAGTAPRLMPLLQELFILTKDLRIVRLGDVMNYAQIDFTRRAERQLATRGQIRICVLKARQIGISTIIEGIAFVMSMLYDDFNSKIVSHEDKSAKGILAMSKRYWSTYIFKNFHAEKYNGQNHLAWDNGSDIDIATAKNLGAGRSATIQFLHASEVAFWPDPETLMTGLNNSIPTFGLTCVFIESTANGVGNFFHKTCNEAMKGESEYEFCFYPWHEHPEYTAQYLPPDALEKYDLMDTSGMSPEEVEEEYRLRTKFGVNDARLLWRRWAIKNRCQGDVMKFHQEYPTTPHEAFVSTGRNVFPLGKLLDHYEPLIGKRGRLIRVNNRIRFVDDPGGYLTIYSEPSDDKDWGVYLLGGDPTHTTAGDNACVQVINRRTLEQVAVYRRKIDPINFGKDMQLIGRWYNDGLLAPEKTGPGYATVGCVLADNYPFVYVTQNVAKMQGMPTNDLYGWATNVQTKHLAISHLLKALLDPLIVVGNKTYGLLIHDEQTLMEMRDYITTEDGQGYENSDGSEYDDGVMAMAIAIAVHNIEPPPPAYEEMAEHLAPRRLAPVGGGSGTGMRTTSGTSRPIDNQPADVRVAKPGRDFDSVELSDENWRENNPPPPELPRLPDFPEDFEDDFGDNGNNDNDAAPWESWKQGAGAS